MKNKPYRSSKLKHSAKGRQCTMNVVNVCNYDPATSVLMHINTEGSSMGSKTDDFSAAIGCSDCHVWYDTHQGCEEDRLFYSRRAIIRTLKIWITEGYLKE